MTSRRRFAWKLVLVVLFPLAVLAVDVTLYVRMHGWTYNVHDDGRATFWPAVLAFGILFFPLAACSLGSAVLDLWNAMASRRWRVTEGRVTDSAVKEEEHSRRAWIGWETYYKYLPKVAYSYEVAGQAYNNDLTAFGLASFGTRGEAERMLAGYPKGAAIRVHYDPDDPKTSVLQSAGAWAWQAMLAALICAFIPFVVAIMLVTEG